MAKRTTNSSKSVSSSDGSRRRAKQSGIAPVTEGQISFEMLKSSLFRAIHVDGAFGGISPTGRYIRMGLYNERRPIPRKLVHPVDQQGRIEPEILSLREERPSIVREVEVDLIMDLLTAKLIKEWLEKRIEEMSSIEQLINANIGSRTDVDG